MQFKQIECEKFPCTQDCVQGVFLTEEIEKFWFYGIMNVRNIVSLKRLVRRTYYEACIVEVER